jgi:hypothetical protein
MLLKILIENPASETVVHNVPVEDLDEWLSLLGECAHGKIRVLDAETGQDYRPPAIVPKKPATTSAAGPWLGVAA